MSAYERFASVAHEPSPAPLSGLTRVQLVARLVVLTDAVDSLWTQARLDGGEHYGCMGSMKKEQMRLRAEIASRDAAEAKMAGRQA